MYHIDKIQTDQDVDNDTIIPAHYAKHKLNLNLTS